MRAEATITSTSTLLSTSLSSLDNTLDDELIRSAILLYPFPTMRNPMGRIFTVFPLLVLLSLSFFTPVEASALASSDLAARHARQFAVKRSIVARQAGNGPGQDAVEDVEGGNDTDGSSQSVSSGFSSTSTSESTSSTSTSSTSTTSSSSSFDPPTTTTSSSSTTSISFSSTISSSSSELTSSSTSSSSSFSSTSTSTSSSSSSQTSSSSSSSSSRSTLQVTTVPGTTAITVVAASTTRRVSSTSSTPSAVSSAAEASSTETAESNGFLSNTGAVAGTFTAVGIVVVGLVCAVVVYIRKKRHNEDLDIFDTEYHDSSGNNLGGTSSGNDDYFASDMTSLSANAVSHAVVHQENSDFSHIDYGYGLPPTTADRTSMASNHAGYGAFRSATEQRKPPMQSSGLRNEMSWGNDAAYAEPAVGENQSVNIVPHDNSQYYASATRVPGTAY